MADFPVGDNAPFDIYPIIDDMDGSELFPVVNKGTLQLYASVFNVGGFSVGVHDVRNFGAVGGSSDSSAAFQAALNAAASGSSFRIVYVPDDPDGYSIGATLNIDAGVTIYGANRKGGRRSMLKPVSGFSSPIIQTRGYGAGRILRPQIIGLCLDGSGTTLTALQLSMQEGIVRDCSILNCWTYGLRLAGYGGGLSEQGLNNLIENNYFTGEGGTRFYDALFLDYHVADTTCRGNYIEAATNSCIRSRAFNDMIISNHLYDAPVLLSSETSCDKLISGNYLENSSGAAMNVSGGSSGDAVLNAVITGNTLRNINKGGASNGVITMSGSDMTSFTIGGNAVRRDSATSYSTPYFVYMGGFTLPVGSVIAGNAWQSGLIATSEYNT